MAAQGHRARVLRFGAVFVAALGLLFAGGASRPSALLYPPGYEDCVRMWRKSGGANAFNATELQRSGWTTIIVPFSLLGAMDGPQMSDDALSIARRELARGRYGATLPFFRQGIGTIVVINDLRLEELKPTEAGKERERSEAGYLEHVRRVTLAAVLAHEATHALQFLRGEIYPGPGQLPFPGHDRQDELEAYLNIDAIYQSELGLNLPRSRYETIIEQDYANLPVSAVSVPERTRAFIEQRATLDRREGWSAPSDFDEALARIKAGQEK